MTGAFTQIRWADIAAVTVILTFLAGVGVLLFQPLCRDWVWAVLKSKKDRDKLEALLREVFDVELERSAHSAEMVAAHEDALTFMRATIERQGEELRQLPRIANSLEQQTRAFREMTLTLGKIHEEVQEHGKRFERWEGFMEGKQGEWKGPDRRQTRRHREGDG